MSSCASALFAYQEIRRASLASLSAVSEECKRGAPSIATLASSLAAHKALLTSPPSTLRAAVASLLSRQLACTLASESSK